MHCISIQNIRVETAINCMKIIKYTSNALEFDLQTNTITVNFNCI